jgi:hypothetical protein
MMVGSSMTRARWGCVLLVLLAGCQSKSMSADREPAAHGAPAAASGPKEPRKDGPRADSPRIAFVKGTLREVAGGQPVGLPCVEGVLERGTPVVLLGIKEGRTCRLVAAEQTGPVAGRGDCTVLEGPCDLKGTTLGVVGVSEAAVQSIEPSAVGGEEEERAKMQAAAAAKDLRPHDWCVVPEGPVTLTPESVRRPLGDQSPILLVQFKETRGGGEGAGPLMALTPAKAFAPWGYPASAVSGFLLNGKPYLWGAGFSYGCGARIDTIYAVEEGATLRSVLSSGFLGD